MSLDYLIRILFYLPLAYNLFGLSIVDYIVKHFGDILKEFQYKDGRYIN